MVNKQASGNTYCDTSLAVTMKNRTTNDFSIVSESFSESIKKKRLNVKKKSSNNLLEIFSFEDEVNIREKI